MEIIYLDLVTSRFDFNVLKQAFCDFNQLKGIFFSCLLFLIYCYILLLAASPLASRGFAPRGNQKKKNKYKLNTTCAASNFM